MGNLQVFKYGNNDVRTAEMNGEPWFVLKDVCKALGIAKYRDVADRLDADERAPIRVDTPGGAQEMTCINESGLYNVILRSDKPEAKPFRKWVTAEVLPTIRKHGAYMTPETLQAAILNPDMMIQLCQQLKAEQEKSAALAATNKQLESENAEMSGKAQYFDAVIDRNLLTNFRTFASELHIKQTVLVQFLLDKKYLYRDTQGKLKAYAERNDGLFEIKEFVNRGNGHAGIQTLITPKGRETFRLLMEAEGLIDMPDDAEDMADAG